MTPLKKLLVVFVIVAVIGAAYYVISNSAPSLEPGAPTAEISLLIDEMPAGTANIGGDAFTPATVIPAHVPPLLPTGLYTIGFVVSVTTNCPTTGQTFHTVVSIAGTHANGQWYFTHAPDTLPSLNQTTLNGQAKDFNLTGADKRFDTIVSGGGNHQAIRGENINGATFTFTIASYGSKGSFGQTTAQIGLIVDPAGAISITIGTISTVVTEATP